MCIFGGQRTEYESSNDAYLYSFDTAKWRRVQPGADLPKMDSHSAVLHGDSMFVFGGYVPATAKFSSAVWKLDLITLQWSLHFSKKDKAQNGEYPEPRASSSVVCLGGWAWLFGGSNGTHTLNDLWKFDLQEGYWLQIVSKDLPAVLCMRFSLGGAARWWPTRTTW